MNGEVEGAGYYVGWPDAIPAFWPVLAPRGAYASGSPGHLRIACAFIPNIAAGSYSSVPETYHGLTHLVKRLWLSPAT